MDSNQDFYTLAKLTNCALLTALLVAIFSAYLFNDYKKNLVAFLLSQRHEDDKSFEYHIEQSFPAFLFGLAVWAIGSGSAMAIVFLTSWGLT